MFRISLPLLLAALFSAPLSHAATNTAPFTLRDGDRVLFLGDTLIERAQSYGYIERDLTARFADKDVIFRNMGWSADTPQGQSRVSFDWRKSPSDWFENLKKEIAQVKPTVVFLGYGMANSFAGAAGVPAFRKQMDDLVDAILALNPRTRFVVLSPVRHENLGAPLPDPTEHNRQLALYTDSLRDLAAARGFWFVSLFDALGDANGAGGQHVTDDGIILNAHGYQVAAAAIDRALGLGTPDLESGSKASTAEAMRQAILKKNELFFYRWRPQNITYLFLFRKHEQGQNAREIPMFDPLVKAEEQKIAGLRQALLNGESVSVPREAPAKVPEASAPLPMPEFDLDPAMEISLWADNPLLAKPIQMNFDPQGRLWVASSSVYPQIKPGEEANDTILVLEDSNGDGEADKSTVFADHLLIPTAVIPGDGGAYVGQSTKLLFFKDTDGDGKADQKRIVLSAFGTEDTHHIVHTLRWGYDGQLYFNQSIYIHSHIETPNGVVRLNSGGVYNFRPEKMKLEVFLRGFCNPWGHAFDRFGQSFETDGAGFQGVSWGVRGATYFTYADMRRELRSISPGSYPKFCGLEMVYSQQFPDDWQGDLITADFRANRVVRFHLDEQGAGYVTKQMPDVIRTRDVTFRPIDVKLGPDGALYIADWSNPIIQHGEVDFRDPRRDHVHGRIWRLKAKDRPLLEKPALVQASNADLFEQLLSPNGFNRDQSRRVLTERGKSILPDLARWTGRHTAEPALLQALWLYESVDQVQPDLLETLLQANDGHIRAAATRVLSFWVDRVPNPLELLAPRVHDSFARVRVEALRALGRIPTARAAELALSVVDEPMDDFIDYACWLTINDLARPWLDAVQSGAWKIEGREKQLQFGLKAVDPSLAGAVIKTLAAKPIPRDGSGSMIELISQTGGPDELRRLFSQVLERGFEPAAAARALNALSEAARLRSVKPSGDLAPLAGLLEHTDPGIQTAAARLAGGWKISALTGRLLEIAGAKNSSAELRQAAFSSLRELGGGDAIQGLRRLVQSGEPGSLRRQAVQALAAINLKQSLPLVIKVITETTNEDEALALWRSLLGLKGAASVISRALPPGGLAESTAKAGLRAAREGGRNEPDLVLALASAASLSDDSHQLTPAELQSLVAQVQKGDPARGEIIYRRKELGCSTCHSIGGAGGKVGPDLTSVGASAPVDYLIDSVLTPNKTVKEGYHSIQVETADGEAYSGILVRENADELVLRDATNREISIPTKDIENRRIGGSLMPAGLADILSPQDRIDLFRFLSELGKPGAYDATRGNVARLWKLQAVETAKAQFGDDTVVQSDLNDPKWSPAATLINGALLQDQLAAQMQTLGSRPPAALFAAARFTTGKSGPVQLRLSAPNDAEVWVDQRLAKQTGRIEAELPAGTHTVVVKLDPRKLPDQLRLETSDGTFLAE